MVVYIHPAEITAIIKGNKVITAYLVITSMNDTRGQCIIAEEKKNRLKSSQTYVSKESMKK